MNLIAATRAEGGLVSYTSQIIKELTLFPFSDQKFFWGQTNFLGLKHLRLKFFQSKIFFGLKFFQTKIIVPKLYLKLEVDTEDQVLF